ncbi:BspA family leucine-rich repeat surface protein [Vibrio parahaemolyticus]|uniref:BspA family leucine-rich repeat surface protein n=1 Tax=Vibrio parahaemolyticus TaxID=670 RepID=UPI000689C737|nr:BspA family leucine-rich repeat surface protein [Vibrio parahaemolyticus]OQT82933.1 hypothetical protein EM98_000130 [Vibrio parahaemolyticus]
MNISKEILEGKRPVNKEELNYLVKNHEYYDLTKLDVSKISDFKSLFADCKTFNQDISSWDVSNGEVFSYMFCCADSFNQDIGGWNVSNGVDFSYMFFRATNFNQYIGNWNVSNGKDFRSMFSNTKNFNKPLNNWDVSNGQNFSYMFYAARIFNQDIGGWDVSKGTDFKSMFKYANSFSFSLVNWNQSNNAAKTFQFYDSRVNFLDTPKSIEPNIFDFNVVDLEDIPLKKAEWYEQDLEHSFIVDMEHLKLMQKEAGIIPHGFKFQGECAYIFKMKGRAMVASNKQVAGLEHDYAYSLINDLKESGLLEEPMSVSLNSLIK